MTMNQFLRISAYIVVAAVVVYLLVGPDGFDPESLRGKNVLVTGASSGIGEQLAMEYAKLGVRLIITARREELLKKVAESCRALGALEVHIVVADMAKESDREHLVSVVKDRLHGSLDHLVLNHAMMGAALWSGTKENMTTLQLYLEVNFLSYVDIASRCRPLLENTKGKIGVVSSTAGKHGIFKLQAYVTSKFALHGFFQSWRQELQWRETGISITMCVLGPIATDESIEIVKENFPNIVGLFNASPRDAAIAILRSVTTRQYEMIYDWKSKILTFFIQLYPEPLENVITFISI